jgi:hypothetical protein
MAQRAQGQEAAKAGNGATARIAAIEARIEARPHLVTGGRGSPTNPYDQSTLPSQVAGCHATTGT